jgi:pimeloyl-ACP methyl ester carboxylesterase
MKRITIIRWIKRLSVALGVIIILFVFVVFPVGISYLLTNGRFRFPERNAKRPEELGLTVVEASFASDDGVSLKGWWNPGDGFKPVIIFSHGLNRSRLELLERAAESHRRGYGILLFDLRNHGESGNSYTTLGIHESRDICAAEGFVRQKSPNRPVLLWGVSLGASTAILGAQRCGGFSAIVSDSAFLSFRDTISHHFRLVFRLPPFPIANLIIYITSVRLGFDPDEGDVEAAVRGLQVPILFIAGSEDRRMPAEVAKRMFDASPHPQKQLLVVPDAGHGDAFETDRETYLNSVYEFFEQVRYNPAPHGNEKSDAGIPLHRSRPRSVVNSGRFFGSHHKRSQIIGSGVPEPGSTGGSRHRDFASKSSRTAS